MESTIERAWNETMYYFLDVDGVLNKESDWRIPFSINEDCLNNFATLIKADKDPHIILSSTWRVGYTNTGVVSAGGNSLFERLEKYSIIVEDSTPIASNKTRQEEIEYYIRRHDITDYVVLDDDESLFPERNKISLYLTDYKTGLTEKDVKAIRKMCKGG